MPLAISGLAVLSLALFGVVMVLRRRLMILRRRLTTETAELARRDAELERTRTELSEAVDRARVAEGLHTDTLKDLDVAHADIAELNRELDEADTLAETQSAELASLAIETEELQAKLTKARNRPVSAGVDPATLWQLELARSERTWRYSVALHPDDISPFLDGADKLQLAVEVEAAALRDEVGAFLNVEWQAEPVEDPARALLILRVAQELLNKASRIDEPTVLAVNTETDAGNLVLRLRPTDSGDHIAVDLRDFHDRNFCSNGMVVPSDEGELRVTVLNLG